MDQSVRNPTVDPQRSDAGSAGGVPAERASASPTLAERHLPATLVLGVVLVLDDGGIADVAMRRQAVADEVGQSGLVGLVVPELASGNADVGAGGEVSGLGQAILAATDRLAADWRYRGLPIGYFALHGCVSAALVAASQRPDIVRAVVGVCGNPLDAGSALGEVRAPTLFIVDDIDTACVETHRRAQHGLHVTNAMKTVPDCRHVLDVAEVRHAAAAMARDWFTGFLKGQRL